MKVTYEKTYREVCSGPDWTLYSDVSHKDSLIVHQLEQKIKDNQNKPFDELYNLLNGAYVMKKVRSKCSISRCRWSEKGVEVKTIEIITRGVFPRFYIGKNQTYDPLLKYAARTILKHQQGSTSLIQRKLKLGYNHASRIIDQLEELGVIGPFKGAKPREILINDENQLNQLIK